MDEKRLTHLLLPGIVRNLRDAAYWAFMLLLFASRFFFTWIYCVLSYFGFKALLDRLRHMPAHFTRGEFAAFAFLTLAGFISGAAWWTTLRNDRTQRIWVTLFTVGSLLVWWFEGGLSVFFSLATWIIMLPTLGGLLVFLLPYRLRLSVQVSSYRVGSPEQKYECDAMAARSLHGLFYWTIMVLLSAGRLAMIWFYYLIFRYAAEVLLDEIRQPAFPIKAEEPWVIAALVIIGFIAAAAGWTTLRRSRSQRLWVVIASLFALVAVAFLFADPATKQSAYPWKLLVIALAGALVYLLPYRLDWSVKVVSFRLNDIDHPSRKLHFSV